jgi:hypothetical protein
VAGWAEWVGPPIWVLGQPGLAGRLVQWHSFGCLGISTRVHLQQRASLAVNELSVAVMPRIRLLGHCVGANWILGVAELWLLPVHPAEAGSHLYSSDQ